MFVEAPPACIWFQERLTPACTVAMMAHLICRTIGFIESLVYWSTPDVEGPLCVEVPMQLPAKTFSARKRVEALSIVSLRPPSSPETCSSHGEE